MTKFQVGFIACGIWMPLFIRKNEIFGLGSTINLIIALSIGVVIYLIGSLIADRFCKE